MTVRFPFLWRRRRVITPTILQMEAAECGAAALGIVLAHYGRYEPLARLRALCGVSRDGSKASTILAAARCLGLGAQAYRLEPDDLRRFSPPLIVYWDFSHFVVVEGFGRNKVYLNDPASGRRTSSIRDFDEGFTGIALAFTKRPDFEKGGVRRNPWRSLRDRLRGHGPATLYVMLATLALLLPSILAAALPTVFLDRVLLGGMVRWQRPLVCGLAAATTLMAFLTWLQQRALLKVESGLAVASSARFLWHLFRLPLDFYVHRQSGEVAFRVASNESLAALLSGEFATNLASLLLAGLYLALMLRFDATLTLIGSGIAALNLIALQVVSRRRSDDNQRFVHERGQLMGSSVNGLLSIETLKAMGSESDFFNRWSGQHAKVANAERQLACGSQPLTVIPPFLVGLNGIALLAIGGLRIMDGVLTIGLLVAYQAMMRAFLDPVSRLVGLARSVQGIEGDLARLDDVLENSMDSQFERQVESQGTRLAGSIELRNVTFGHNPLQPPLISAFDLTVGTGRRIAIVGRSGSGKSTLVRLVAGIYAPSSGEILFDGMPRAMHARETITNSVAFVDQEITLFEGTIRANISLWDETLDEETIFQAARDALIHDDILRFPDGYQYKVEESGRNLSGGQRQRVEIARTLALNPRILILDEATSALDPLTEELLADNLRRRGCTCLIVAHRLSTIRECDEIIVVDRGRMVERGIHEDLLRRGGTYSDLLQDFTK
jgi:NHLM bacteriocin system ABC transporter peptidase/ATP-binding protein